MADGISNLLENNLLLSLLSQGGASLAGEGSVAAGINPIIQGTIAAQSKTKEQNRQMQMIKKLLGPGVDFKSDASGKATVSGALASILGGDSGGSKLGDLSLGDRVSSGDPTSGGFGGTPTGVQQIQEANKPVQNNNLDFLRSIVNPSASPLDVPAYSDLVGLTPKDISETLAGAISTEDLRSKIAASVEAGKIAQARSDISRRQAATAERKAKVSELAEWRKIKEIPSKVEVDVEGKTLSVDPKDALNFYAKKYDLPTSYDTYKIAQEDPEFKTHLLEMAKAGSTNISLGERLDTQAEKYFTDPKGLANDVDKFINTEDVQNKLIALEPDQLEIETIREKENFITGKIVSAGGEIVGQKLDGRTFIWTVKWPSGKTSEVRYAN